MLLVCVLVIILAAFCLCAAGLKVWETFLPNVYHLKLSCGDAYHAMWKGAPVDVCVPFAFEQVSDGISAPGVLKRIGKWPIICRWIKVDAWEEAGYLHDFLYCCGVPRKMADAFFAERLLDLKCPLWLAFVMWVVVRALGAAPSHYQDEPTWTLAGEPVRKGP